MDHDIRIAAEQLGTMIRSVGPIADHIRAREALEHDAEAQRLLDDLAKCQQTLRGEQKTGRLCVNDIEEFRRKREAALRNGIIAAYYRSKNAALEHCREIAVALSERLGVDVGAMIAPTSGCC